MLPVQAGSSVSANERRSTPASAAEAWGRGARSRCCRCASSSSAGKARSISREKYGVRYASIPSRLCAEVGRRRAAEQHVAEQQRTVAQCAIGSVRLARVRSLLREGVHGRPKPGVDGRPGGGVQVAPQARVAPQAGQQLGLARPTRGWCAFRRTGSGGGAVRDVRRRNGQGRRMRCSDHPARAERTRRHRRPGPGVASTSAVCSPSAGGRRSMRHRRVGKRERRAELGCAVPPLQESLIANVRIGERLVERVDRREAGVDVGHERHPLGPAASAISPRRRTPLLDARAATGARSPLPGRGRRRRRRSSSAPRRDVPAIAGGVDVVARQGAAQQRLARPRGASELRRYEPSSAGSQARAASNRLVSTRCPRPVRLRATTAARIADRRQQRTAQVRHLRRRHDRRAVGGRVQPEQTGQRDVGQVVPGAVAVRAGLTEAAQRGVDQSRLQPRRARRSPDRAGASRPVGSSRPARRCPPPAGAAATCPRPISGSA